MIETLLVIQILLTIAIVIAILLQKSSSIGLGAYSGSNESMFGALLVFYQKQHSLWPSYL